MFIEIPSNVSATKAARRAPGGGLRVRGGEPQPTVRGVLDQQIVEVAFVERGLAGRAAEPTGSRAVYSGQTLAALIKAIEKQLVVLAETSSKS
jgi:hypothetical protein